MRLAPPVLSAFVLSLACGGGAPSSSPSPSLVDSLVSAALERTAIADVEAAVEQRAILSSDRAEDRGALSMVDFAHDELGGECPDAGDLSSDAGVAYWGRGSEDSHGNPRVIGLRWRASGEVDVFCAVVLPP